LIDLDINTAVFIVLPLLQGSLNLISSCLTTIWQDGEDLVVECRFLLI